MDLAQKIGQLLVVGFSGTEVTQQLENLIRKLHVGNIILFERNCQTPEQIFKLTQDLQKIAMESNGVPMLIAIDQENGMVTRIHNGITVFPGNMAQAAGASIEEIKQIARFTATGLLALGINFNLAPSVDINNNPYNPVIGVRSFGDTPERVIERASACIQGFQEMGMVATAKHFPGHGDTKVDSHLALSSVTHSKDRLENVELRPFKAAIENHVKAIMTAHIIFPAYEPEPLPATLSHSILTQLLRDKLGFNGVVITDCMEMKGIEANYGASEATPMAIAAGADLICLSHSEEKQIGAVTAIYQALADGKLTETRINESVNRILKLKEDYDIDRFLRTTYLETKKHLYQEEHEALAEKVSQQSITVTRNNGLIPITAKSVFVVAPKERSLTGAESKAKVPNFAKSFRNQAIGHQVEIYEFDENPTHEQLAEITENAKNHELVILCTYNAILISNQIELAQHLLTVNPKVILIPLRNPYDSEVLKDIKCCLLPYEYTSHSINSLIKVLMGEIKAKGKRPINIT